MAVLQYHERNEEIRLTNVSMAAPLLPFVLNDRQFATEGGKPDMRLSSTPNKAPPEWTILKFGLYRMGHNECRWKEIVPFPARYTTGGLVCERYTCQNAST